jgi:hypothetical protein
VLRDEPKELKGIPGSQYFEALTASYNKFSEVQIEGEGEEKKLDLFVSSEEPRSILAYENSGAHCIDEFVGFKSLNKGKIDSAMTSPKYAFCHNSGTTVAIPNIKVEPKLTCAETGWTRLDCKFTPKNDPDAVFFASRLGQIARIAGLASKAGMPRVSKALETGGRALRAITSPITSIFSDDVQTFTDRVSCQKQLQKPQIDECNSLLSAWTTINDAVGSPSKSSAAKKNVAASDTAQTNESDEEAGDVKQGEGKKSSDAGDESSVSSDSSSVYYILGGVGVLIILIVVATQCMGDKKKEREDGQDARRKSRRNRTEAQTAQDSPETEKRSHRRK